MLRGNATRSAGTSPPDAAGRPSRLRQRVRRGVTWAAAARIGGGGLALLANVVAARLLAPQDFGRFVLSVSILTICGVLARCGMGRTLIRFTAQNAGIGRPATARNVLRLGWCVALCSTAGTAMVAVPLQRFAAARWFGLPDTWRFALLIALGIGLVSLVQLAADSLRGLHVLSLSSLLDVQARGPLVNLLFVMLLLGAGAAGIRLTFEQALAIYVSGLALLLPVSLLALLRCARGTLAGADRAEASPVATPSLAGLLVVGLPIMATQLLHLGYARLDIWFVGLYCTADDLALFGAARRLVQVVTMPLMMANFAVMSSIPELHAQGRLAELQRTLQATAALAAAPCVAGALLLLLLPGTILGTLFGTFYAQAAFPLIILTMGQLVGALAGPATAALTMTGRHLAVLVVHFLMTLLLLSTISFVGSRFGMPGIAALSAGVAAAGSITLWLLTRRLLGFWTHAWIRRLPLPAAARS
jgi:O-antigen/teichoic acid export membrane protein